MEIKKTLGIKYVGYDDIIVIADSSKHDIPEAPKVSFKQGQIDFSDVTSIDAACLFRDYIIQNNHDFLFVNEKDRNKIIILVDEIEFYVESASNVIFIISTEEIGDTFSIPKNHLVNNFTTYKSFYMFYKNIVNEINFKKQIIELLNQNGFGKPSLEIENNENGFMVKVSPQDSSSRDFVFEYYKKNNIFKFIAFLEYEGEIYHYGNEYITRDIIESRIRSQQKLLEKHDRMVEVFNNLKIIQ